jgi:hypothetical protein
VAAALALGISVMMGSSMPASAGTQALPAAQPVPGTTSLTGISCPSVTFCVAIGSDDDMPVVVPITDGSAGTPEEIPGYGQPGTPMDMTLNAVTCSSTDSCMAVGGGETPLPPSRLQGVGVFVPIFDGAPTGVAQVSGNGQIGEPDQIVLHGVACSSASSCVAVGWDLYLDGVAVRLNKRGPENEVPVPAFQLNGVMCRRTGVCLAVGSGVSGGGVLVPLMNGKVAEGGGGVDGVSSLNGVACHAASTCLAVGDSSVIAPMTRENPGTANPVPGAGGLAGVACHGPIFCVAVGADTSGVGAMVRITSAEPGNAKPVPGSSGLNGVSCPSPDFCLAVGENALNEGVMATVPLPSTH